MNNKAVVTEIEQRLIASLNPQHLLVCDESAQHIGHPGAQAGGGHFSIEMTSLAFVGKTTLEQHRLIYRVLGELMQTQIHALRITTKIPNIDTL